jgi:hypothetical protein
MNYKKHWDNFNTSHYLNVLTERRMIEVKKEIELEYKEQRKEFSERFAVLVGFTFLVASIVGMFKLISIFY